MLRHVFYFLSIGATSSTPEDTLSESCVTPFSSPSPTYTDSLNNMTKTAMKCAKQADKWVEVIHHILTKASPAKQLKLKQFGIVCSPEKVLSYERVVRNLSEECESFKLKRDKTSLFKKRLFAGIINKPHKESSDLASLMEVSDEGDISLDDKDMEVSDEEEVSDEDISLDDKDMEESDEDAW